MRHVLLYINTYHIIKLYTYGNMHIYIKIKIYTINKINLNK